MQLEGRRLAPYEDVLKRGWVIVGREPKPSAPAAKIPRAPAPSPPITGQKPAMPTPKQVKQGISASSFSEITNGIVIRQGGSFSLGISPREILNSTGRCRENYLTMFETLLKVDRSSALAMLEQAAREGRHSLEWTW
jgi:hypothetical protein